MWDPDGISVVGLHQVTWMKKPEVGMMPDMLGFNFHFYYNIFLFPV